MPFKLRGPLLKNQKSKSFKANKKRRYTDGTSPFFI
jgi:hypothetical protein